MGNKKPPRTFKRKLQGDNHFSFSYKIQILKDCKFNIYSYSEKATTFCEIFPLLLTTVNTVKSKGKISQNFVAFSEYMTFILQKFTGRCHCLFSCQYDC